MKIMNAIFILIASVCGLILVFVSINSIVDHKRDYNRLKSSKAYHDTTNLRKQGGTTMFGPNGFNNPTLNYDLRSWDAGKTWYACDYNFDDKTLKVLGLADSIHPGLLEHLQGWNDLTNYVSKHGPIDFTDPKGIEVLEGAGFTVETKEE